MTNASASLDVVAIVMPAERFVEGLFGAKELYMQPAALVREGRVDFNSQRGVLKAGDEMANAIGGDSHVFHLVENQMTLIAHMRDVASSKVPLIAYSQTTNRYSNQHWRRVQRAIERDVAASSVSHCRMRTRGDECASRQVEDHIHGLLNSLQVPTSWLQDGVSPPTTECLEESLKIMKRLFAADGMIPYKIAASREGGVFAAYRQFKNGKILRLDVDNDLDAVAVVSDGTTVLGSAFIGHAGEESRLLEMFA